jgi:hypothetical protein
MHAQPKLKAAYRTPVLALHSELYFERAFEWVAQREDREHAITGAIVNNSTVPRHKVIDNRILPRDGQSHTLRRALPALGAVFDIAE